MPGEAERIEEERGLRELALARPEIPVLEEQVHDRTAEDDHQDGRRQGEEQDPADPLLDGIAHPVHLAERGEVRER